MSSNLMLHSNSKNNYKREINGVEEEEEESVLVTLKCKSLSMMSPFINKLHTFYKYVNINKAFYLPKFNTFYCKNKILLIKFVPCFIQ